MNQDSDGQHSIDQLLKEVERLQAERDAAVDALAAQAAEQYREALKALGEM